MVNGRIGKGTNARGRNGKGRNGRGRSGHKPILTYRPERKKSINTFLHLFRNVKNCSYVVKRMLD